MVSSPKRCVAGNSCREELEGIPLMLVRERRVLGEGALREDSRTVYVHTAGRQRQYEIEL